MQTFYKKYRKDKYSQNGEDGIIDEIISRLKFNGQPVCAEFGAADGFYFSNTRVLLERGWKGILYDIKPSGDVLYAKIDRTNVNDLIPANINLLSVDVDGDDYYIWQAYKGSPEIVIIEINSSIPPDEERPINIDIIGCGYRQMLKLGLSKDYFLVCHTGNFIFVLNKFKHLFPEITGDPLTETDNYFNPSWLKQSNSLTSKIKQLFGGILKKRVNPSR